MELDFCDSFGAFVVLGGYLWSTFGDVEASLRGLGGFPAAGEEEVVTSKRIVLSKREALGSLATPWGA